MATLLEAEVKVILLIHCLLVFHQYLVQVVPDLGLGVKFSDPGIDKEVGSLIKVTSNQEVRYEVIFVVLVDVGGVSVILGWPRACRAPPPPHQGYSVD